jgi:asparagine synthetase B (glutamine-hydrolysing)
MQHRDSIKALMAPHSTEMDLSIASALYFASRGIGQIYTNPTTNNPNSTPTGPTLQAYTTPTRVLLSGLGADELFAGYARHALAFHRHGYPALLAELALDAGRLGKRNLGRDDRVTGHWGREVRYPFLDEWVVGWAMGAPVWEKCGFRPSLVVKAGDEAGIEVTIQEEKDPKLDDEKLLLRLLAWKCGLWGIAREKKRAVGAHGDTALFVDCSRVLQIQFGSRTAKMHSGKAKGTDDVT